MGPFFGPVKWFSFSMEKPSKKLRNSAAPPGSGRLRWFCQWQMGLVGPLTKTKGDLDDLFKKRWNFGWFHRYTENFNDPELRVVAWDAIL